MNNVFMSLRMYAGNWVLVDSRPFNEAEKASVTSATVVDSQYGPSVCFMMKTGQRGYIPVSSNSSLKIGDAVDMNTAKVITLFREGDGNITRIE